MNPFTLNFILINTYLNLIGLFSLNFFVISIKLRIIQLKLQNVEKYLKLEIP